MCNIMKKDFFTTIVYRKYQFHIILSQFRSLTNETPSFLKDSIGW